LADVVDTNNDAAAKVVTDKAGISPIRPASLLLNKEGVVKHENIKKAIAEAQEFIKRGKVKKQPPDLTAGEFNRSE